MTCRVSSVAVALALMVAALGAHAGEIGLCQEPFAYDTAVNVYVLEDGERGADRSLRDVRKRLAWLVKLDALFHDSYGSLGVHFLSQPPGGEICTLDTVIERTLRRLRPGSAAIFLDQRVYREGDQILLQSYLRFFRTDNEARVRPEAVALAPGSGHPTFTELLPAQRTAFLPLMLTIQDLDAIERAFADASLLYPKPRAEHGKRLPLSPDHPLPFLVTEALPDGWMRIDATAFQGDLRGWLRADPSVSARLRERLPELGFLDGVVGYLSWLEARDGHALESKAADRIGRRAGEVLARYVERVPVAEDAGPSPALAQALRTAMALDDPVGAGTVLPVLINAVQHAPPDSRLRNLLGITRLAGCCRKTPGPDAAASRATWLVGLAGALNDFQGALAIDPGNDRALANLEAIYTMVGELTEFPLTVQVSPDAPDPLREAYSRALARLPRTRAELDTRIAEIGSLRAAAEEIAEGTPTRVRGTVEKLDGRVLTVKSREGQELTIALAPNFTVSYLVKKTIEDIKAGDYVAAASMKGTDGKNHSVELRIFPESLRGAAEGQFARDLMPDSVMTNATVSGVTRAPQGRIVKVTYKGNESEIVVGTDTPIFGYGAGDASLLKSGVAIFTVALKKADGTLSAASVTAEKDGIKPPM